MSRARSQRPVLSEFHRRLIAIELRRSVLSVLPRSSDLTIAAFGITGKDVSADVPISGMLSGSSASAGAATNAERIEVLVSTVDALKASASASGLATDRFELLADRLEDAAAAVRPLDASEGTFLVAAVESEVNRLEDDLVDALCDVRALELAAAAAAEVFHRVGLANVAVATGDGAMTITGFDASGQRAELGVSSSNLRLTVDDPRDAVHPLNPAAGDLCRGAADLEKRVNAAISHVFTEVGLEVGDVEVVEPATRGSATATYKKCPPERRATWGGA